MKKFDVIQIVLLILTLMLVRNSYGESSAGSSIKILQKIHGSLITSVKGTSTSKLPYVGVIRSKEGLDYLINDFMKHKNRTTHARLKSLRSSLSSVNFNEEMIVSVLSPPIDNYKLKLVDVRSKEEEGYMEVQVDYTHRLVNYRIPPYKSIYYLMIVVPKNSSPVVLKPVHLQAKKAKEQKSKPVKVTGKLLRGTNNDLHLVPLKIKRGSKNSYYIRGSQAKELEPYIGKVVTLEGEISREKDGPYESDLTVTRIVKVQ